MTDTLDPSSPADPSGSRPELAPDEPPAAAGGFKAVVSMAAILTLFAFAAVNWGIWALVIIVGLIISIVLHEFGHFLAAKQAGMKVTEFFIGFGPRLWSFHRGETEYGVKPIWAGAYVRIIGMNNLEEVDPADEGNTYREKGYWARLRVVLAGPFMNLAIAFVLLFTLYAGFGMADGSHWKIKEAVADSAAAQAGVQPNDRVISMAGVSTTDFHDFGDVITANAGRQVDLVVERDGQEITLHPTIRWALDDGAADLMHPLAPGDRVTELAGRPVSTYDEVVEAMAAAPPGTVAVQFEREGYLYTTELSGAVTLPPDGAKGFLGVSSAVEAERQGPVQAVGSAADQFGSMVGASLEGLGKFFSPSGLSRYANLVFTTPPQGVDETAPAQEAAIVPVDPTSPPASAAPGGVSAADENRVLSLLGVVRLGGQAGEAGPQAVFFLLALVNLFLGLINLMPLMPFDGGHAAVATYEAIRGRISGRPYRADITKLMPIAYLVIVLFVFVGLSSFYLDAVRPAANPYGP